MVWLSILIKLTKLITVPDSRLPVLALNCKSLAVSDAVLDSRNFLSVRNASNAMAPPQPMITLGQCPLIQTLRIGLANS